MWWFVYLIVSSQTPVVHRLPESPAFHTEEQCIAWLVAAVREHRLEIADDVLATCMSPPEPV
jgi:hypothetical protein